MLDSVAADECVNHPSTQIVERCQKATARSGAMELKSKRIYRMSIHVVHALMRFVLHVRNPQSQVVKSGKSTLKPELQSLRTHALYRHERLAKA